MSTRSDVIVPYEWIVPGAYAKYIGGSFSLFYPNYTLIDFSPEGIEAFLEWTVLERVGDSVLLNLTFFVNGTGNIVYTESVPDGKVDILDIATVAKAFGTEAYEWEFDPNADVTEDQKVDIMDIATVAKAYGTTQDDPKYNPNADIAPEEKREVSRHVVHRKTLLLDIDVYSRDTFLNGKPLGKTCFWMEPYADVGDKVVLYGLPPEEINGTVRKVDDEWGGWWGWPDITTYDVFVFQIDPFAGFRSYFDWNTGMAMKINLLGSWPVNPDGDYSVGFPNGTEYVITRFASTPLGTELNVGTAADYPMVLNFTNVQLGPP